MKLIDIDGVETVELVVRNVDGVGALFTSDGKLIGHQVESLSGGALCPHYYYDGHGADRTTMFRATFVVDSMKDKPPRG